MKSYKEWTQESTRDSNPEILLDKLNDLSQQIEQELKTFQGDRFDGFLDLVGTVRAMQRTLAEINTGTVGDAVKGLSSVSETSIRKMEKINHKSKISKGTRNGEDDLSKDYKGHIKKNGTVEPFKVI